MTLPNPKSIVEHWTVDDVYYYITDLELDGLKFTPEEATAFRKECVNGKLFLNLDKDDLNILGMDHLTKRNALYDHIQKIKGGMPTYSSIPSIPPSLPSVPIHHQWNGANIVPSNYCSNSWNEMSSNVQTAVMGTMSVPLMSSQFNALNMNSINPISSRPRRNSLPLNLSATHSVPMPSFNSTDSVVDSSNTNNTNNTMTTEHSQQPQSRRRNVRSSKDMENLNDISITDISSVTGDGNGCYLVFPGVYQGFNLHFKTYILMTKEHRKQLEAARKSVQSINTEKIENKQSEQSSNENNLKLKETEITKTDQISQGFECKIPAEKVPFGWKIESKKGGVMRLPFNPLVRCRLDVVSNEILEIEPVVVSGSINHVNRMGNIWILSDIGVSAKEENHGNFGWREISRKRSSGHLGGTTAGGGEIVSLELSDLEDTSIQKRRGCSYFIHDPDEYGVNTPWRFKIGEKVSFRLKLSTRSSTTPEIQEATKDRFVQCWDVQLM